MYRYVISDYELHVIQPYLKLIFFAIAMSFFLYYIIIAITSLHQYYTTTSLIYQSLSIQLYTYYPHVLK